MHSAQFLILALLVSWWPSCRAATAATPATRPNILWITSEDNSPYLGCYGEPLAQTPHLDRLADEGARFLNAYSAAPYCSAARAGLMTGRYPVRSALDHVLQAPGTWQDMLLKVGGLNCRLPVEEITIAEVLAAAGYETALVGKWHLGWKPEFGPNQHGYDEFFGILSGASDYFKHGDDLWENLTPVQRVGYLTDLLAQRTIATLERRRADRRHVPRAAETRSVDRAP